MDQHIIFLSGLFVFFIFADIFQRIKMIYSMYCEFFNITHIEFSMRINGGKAFGLKIWDTADGNFFLIVFI